MQFRVQSAMLNTARTHISIKQNARTCLPLHFAECGDTLAGNCKMCSLICYSERTAPHEQREDPSRTLYAPGWISMKYTANDFFLHTHSALLWWLWYYYVRRVIIQRANALCTRGCCIVTRFCCVELRCVMCRESRWSAHSRRRTATAGLNRNVKCVRRQSCASWGTAPRTTNSDRFVLRLARRSRVANRALSVRLSTWIACRKCLVELPAAPGGCLQYVH